MAIGQTSNPLLVRTIKGLQLWGRGYIKVDQDGRTNIPGIFAGGDIATGAAVGASGFAEIAQQDSPATFPATGIGHDPVQFFQFVRLVQLEGLKVDVELFRLWSLQHLQLRAVPRS